MQRARAAPPGSLNAPARPRPRALIGPCLSLYGRRPCQSGSFRLYGRHPLSLPSRALAAPFPVPSRFPWSQSSATSPQHRQRPPGPSPFSPPVTPPGRPERRRKWRARPEVRGPYKSSAQAPAASFGRSARSERGVRGGRARAGPGGVLGVFRGFLGGPAAPNPLRFVPPQVPRARSRHGPPAGAMVRGVTSARGEA